MTAPLLGLAAAALGLIVGAATHWANQVLGRAEEEATEPPLPGERYWAPVLDAAVLGFIFYRSGVNTTSLAAALLVAVLVQVFVFDARHHLILNRVMYPAMALALLASPVNPLIQGASAPAGRIVSAVLGALAGGGVFLLFVIASRGGVGLGDAKLTFFMGAALGLLPIYSSPVLHSLIYGVVIGGLIAAALLITRARGMRDYIAYGPFLCIGGVTQVLFPCSFLGNGGC
jgi:prepilin signal peptidase PulO-like enzyme (type II secretory pathway)